MEIDVITDVGLLRSSVPSTVWINPNQAQEIRDETAAYRGRSVFKAVDIVNNVIAPQLMKSKLEVSQQAEIDALLNKLDGTENKSRLGVNAILGVSVACCKAGAARKGLPVYRSLLISRRYYMCRFLLIPISLLLNVNSVCEKLVPLKS